MAGPPLPGLSNYSVDTSYVGPDNGAVPQSWLLPPSYSYKSDSDPGKTPDPPLRLPYLWTGEGDFKSIACSNEDFVLGAISTGPASPAYVYVTLQLTGVNAWKTRSAARASLRANYLSLLAEVEKKLELGSPPLLVRGATALIGSTLAQYMPLPVSEALLYGCGLQTGIGSTAPAAVDVVPGMRLRSEPSARQYLSPPNQSFSGYVSSGALEWITSTNVSAGTAVQAFDPFLGTIAAPQVTPPPSSPAPIYGLIDLQQTGGAFKYYRLIYPQNIIAGGAPGESGAATNIQIIGADNLADLEANPPYQAYFFGRDIVVPEIAIWLQLTSNTNPQMIWVPVGTTPMNLLERFTRWLPLNPGQNVLKLQRLALNPNWWPQGGQSYWNVAFGRPGLAVNDLRAFALPLLPGDYLTIVLGQN